MPLYEYRCLACGIRFERRQSVKDDPIKVCPEGTGQARKVLHPVGIIFKGSGFYVTDSRNSQSAVKPAGSSTGGNGDKSEKPATPAKKEESKVGAESKPAPEKAG